MNIGILLLAHLLYDFHWQGDYIAKGKNDSLFLLFIHSLTWALIISFALQYIGLFVVGNFSFLLISHLLIDFYKTRNVYGIYVDQTLHLITLVIVMLV